MKRLFLRGTAALVTHAKMEMMMATTMLLLEVAVAQVVELVPPWLGVSGRESRYV